MFSENVLQRVNFRVHHISKMSGGNDLVIRSTCLGRLPLSHTPPLLQRGVAQYPPVLKGQDVIVGRS